MRVRIKRGDGSEIEVETRESPWDGQDDRRVLKMLASLAPESFSDAEHAHLDTLNAEQRRAAEKMGITQEH